MTDIPINTNHAPSSDSDESRGSHEHHIPVTQEGQQQKSRAMFIGIVVVLVIIIIATVRNNDDEATEKEPIQTRTAVKSSMSVLDNSMVNKALAQDTQKLTVEKTWLANFADITFRNNAALADVTGGSASGRAGNGMIDGAFHVYATFESLPALEQGFSYEGWLVRTEPLSVISTGTLVEYNGGLVNAYLSRTNLTDHTTYVLTKEPNDGDAAPAQYILEGTFTEGK